MQSRGWLPSRITNVIYMDELYPSKRWMKTVAPEGTNHATKGKRVEVLWTNYDVNHGFLKARAKASGNGGHGWLFKDFA